MSGRITTIQIPYLNGPLPCYKNDKEECFINLYGKNVVCLAKDIGRDICYLITNYKADLSYKNIPVCFDDDREVPFPKEVTESVVYFIVPESVRKVLPDRKDLLVPQGEKTYSDDTIVVSSFL